MFPGCLGFNLIILINSTTLIFENISTAFAGNIKNPSHSFKCHFLCDHLTSLLLISCIHEEQEL